MNIHLLIEKKKSHINVDDSFSLRLIKASIFDKFIVLT